MIQRFPDSIFPLMTGMARQYGAVNLSQGFPDWPAPEAVKQAAVRAINADLNQYAITSGAKNLRDALSSFYRAKYAMSVDPDRELTVCCGATEASLAALLSTVTAGDEVIIFEPFYETYGPQAILCGATPRYVSLHPNFSGAGGWELDRDELRRAFNAKTRAIIINTPGNPTGKVFTRDELQFVAELCIQHNVIAITDEIYEFITYDHHAHIPMATLPGMAGRTVTIGGMSKTFSVTGWRLGYCVASPEITFNIRKAHEYMTVCAPAPMQEAAVAMLNLGDDYYAQLKADYTRKRNFLVGVLREVGFEVIEPEGTYYIITRFGKLRKGDEDDMQFAARLVKEHGVACVPCSAFYADKDGHRDMVRFAFCKKDETLEEAAKRLGTLTNKK